MSTVIAEPVIAKGPSFGAEKEKPLSLYEAQKFAMLAAQLDAENSGAIAGLERGMRGDTASADSTTSNQSSATKPNTNTSYTGYDDTKQQSPAETANIVHQQEELLKAQIKQANIESALPTEGATAKLKQQSPRVLRQLSATKRGQGSIRSEAGIPTASELRPDSLTPGLDLAGAGLLGGKQLNRTSRNNEKNSRVTARTPITLLPAGSTPLVPAISVTETSPAVNLRR